MTKQQQPSSVKRTSVHAAIGEIDGFISDQIYEAYKASKLGKAPLVILELSGHGVPWLLFTFCTFAFLKTLNETQRTIALNLFIGLVTDLLIIVFLKPIVGRPRPVHDTGKQLGTVQVIDQFSFPSGHATRAWFVLTFALGVLIKLKIGSKIMVAFLFVWACLVAFSRVALGRHYLGDVLAGIALGILNTTFILFLWVPISKFDMLKGYVNLNLLG
mmetsp:Transcript_8232/g.14655  ORF Transcript_8232/g.14655 Transcript_8232/m.14655 type:complete len:216 (+) Transcript_8232:151-798(+)